MGGGEVSWAWPRKHRTYLVLTVALHYMATQHSIGRVSLNRKGMFMIVFHKKLKENGRKLRRCDYRVHNALCRLLHMFYESYAGFCNFSFEV